MAVKKIPLTQGLYARVGAQDYAWIGQWKWTADRRKHYDLWYAVRVIKREDGKWGKKIYMHRLILQALPGQEIDHKDNDGLNNTRKNLRFATRAENNHNTRMRISNTSGFKGVSWDKNMNLWQAKITIRRQQIHLGRYDSPQDAYAAYCQASKHYHKDFGRIR